MPLPQGQIPLVDQTSASITEGQVQSPNQGQSLSQKRTVNPAIIGGMFQRIQNVTGCGSCGGAV